MAEGLSPKNELTAHTLKERVESDAFCTLATSLVRLLRLDAQPAEHT